MKVAVEISSSKRVLQDHFLSLEASFFWGGGCQKLATEFFDSELHAWMESFKMSLDMSFTFLNICFDAVSKSRFTYMTFVVKWKSWDSRFISLWSPVQWDSWAWNFIILE